MPALSTASRSVLYFPSLLVYTIVDEVVFSREKEAVRVGGTHFMHGRSRMAIDPRISTMPGRSTSGFQGGGGCN